MDVKTISHFLPTLSCVHMENPESWCALKCHFYVQTHVLAAQIGLKIARPYYDVLEEIWVRSNHVFASLDMIVFPQSFKFESRLGPMREIRGQWSVIMPNSCNSRSVFCSNEIAAHNLEKSVRNLINEREIVLWQLDSNNKEERRVKHQRTLSKLPENPKINVLLLTLGIPLLIYRDTWGKRKKFTSFSSRMSRVSNHENNHIFGFLGIC